MNTMTKMSCHLQTLSLKGAKAPPILVLLACIQRIKINALFASKMGSRISVSFTLSKCSTFSSYFISSVSQPL